MAGPHDRSRYDLVVAGRAGVDLYSLDYGVPLRDAKRFAKYVGGSAANIAVGAARLGLKVALVSRVSDDALGRFVIEFLESEGVETRYVALDEGRKTGIVFAEISPERDGEFLFYRADAADLALTADDLPPALLQGAGFFVATGTGLSASPSAETTQRALQQAYDAGVTTVLNLDWRPTLWGSVRKTVRLQRYESAIGKSRIVLGNESEYLAATGSTDPREAVDKVLDGGVQLAVMTRGKHGATVSGRTIGTVKAPGFRVRPLKGLGAGDAFAAGFLYGRARDWSIQRCMTFANAMGAIVTTKHSCSEGMPTRRAVVAFLNERERRRES